MNKPGYKHTPLGWIPDEWEAKKLGTISKITSGGTPDRKKPEYWNGNIPWVTTSLIDFNEIQSANEFITEEGLKNSAAKLFPAGTLLMALYGQGVTRGKVATLKIPATTNQACAAIAPLNGYADNAFLFQFLTLNYENIRNLSNSGSQENLSGELLKSIDLPLPPLAEQRKIAAILSTWDSAIAAERTLIAALQIRHRALSQRLLSGKLKLKGFTGEWKEIRIGAIAKEVSQKNKEDNALVVLSCTKYDGLVPSLEYFGRKIFADDLTTYKVVPRNHFAYATNHIEEGSIGYQTVFEAGLISPMYTVFKTSDNEVNDGFLFRLLKTPDYIHEYRRRMEGSIDRRGGLRWDEFSKIKLSLPHFSEQINIANVLTTSEKEVGLHRARLAALQQQKKGLMQVLLTGKKRVTI